MGARIGVHYSTFAAMHGVICTPGCPEKPTHWECWEYQGFKHSACIARCDKHRAAEGDGMHYSEIKRE